MRRGDREWGEVTENVKRTQRMSLSHREWREVNENDES